MNKTVHYFRRRISPPLLQLIFYFVVNVKLNICTQIVYDALSIRLNDRANLQKLFPYLIPRVFFYQCISLVTADQIKLYAMLAAE
jgi:hypothetical protein